MDDNNFITSSVCRSLSFVLSIEHGHPTAELQSGSDIVNSWICNSISPSLLNQRHVNSQLLGIKDLNFYLQIFIFAEYIFWWLFSPQEGFPASSQRVSSPATEKHQDICTIPLAAFDPVSWLHRQGCSPSRKEKNCFSTPKAKSSKHPIFGVLFVWINFWKFPHLPIEIMESLVCQHFPFFFQMEKFHWWSMGYFHTPTFGLDTVGPFRTLTGLLLRILAAFSTFFLGADVFRKRLRFSVAWCMKGWNKNKTSDRYCTKTFSMNLQVIINLKIQWCSNRQLNLELWVRQMHPWTLFGGS